MTKNLKKYLACFGFALLFIFLFIGCSNNQTSNTSKPIDTSSLTSQNVYDDIKQYINTFGNHSYSKEIASFTNLNRQTIKETYELQYNQKDDSIRVRYQYTDVFSEITIYNPKNNLTPKAFGLHILNKVSTYSYYNLSAPTTDLSTIQIKSNGDSMPTPERETIFRSKQQKCLKQSLQYIDNLYTNLIKKNPQYQKIIYNAFNLPTSITV